MKAAFSTILLVALGTVALSATAIGQQQKSVEASRPEQILAIARGFGSAELEKDKLGDPKINGRMEGSRYGIAFYGCKEGKNCKSIQFQAAFTVDKKPTLEAVNTFNEKNRFGKAYLDKDQDPVLEFDVNLDGGVSTKNMDDTFDWWKTILRTFKKNFVD